MTLPLGLLLAALASAPETPVGSEVPWEIWNQDGTATAVQVAKGEGCEVVARDGAGQELWRHDGCLGGKSDRKALSMDGKRLIVLAAVPVLSDRSRGGWRKVPVAWLFAQGKLVEEAVLAQFVKDGAKLRVGVSRVKWMEGVAGIPGVPAGLDESGTKVRVDAVDGTHSLVSFGPMQLPPPAPEPVKTPRWRR